MPPIAQDEKTGNARNRLAAGASAETRMRTMTDQQQLEALGAARQPRLQVRSITMGKGFRYFLSGNFFGVLFRFNLCAEVPLDLGTSATQLHGIELE